MRGGYLGRAGGAAIESATFAEKRWASGGVDGAVLKRWKSLAGFFRAGQRLCERGGRQVEGSW